jgi:hypothetical protein
MEVLLRENAAMFELGPVGLLSKLPMRQFTSHQE